MEIMLNWRSEKALYSPYALIWFLQTSVNYIFTNSDYLRTQNKSTFRQATSSAADAWTCSRNFFIKFVVSARSKSKSFRETEIGEVNMSSLSVINGCCWRAWKRQFAWCLLIKGDEFSRCVFWWPIRKREFSSIQKPCCTRNFNISAAFALLSSKRWQISSRLLPRELVEE